jgi:hypothetical protein
MKYLSITAPKMTTGRILWMALLLQNYARIVSKDNKIFGRNFLLIIILIIMLAPELTKYIGRADIDLIFSR